MKVGADDVLIICVVFPNPRPDIVLCPRGCDVSCPVAVDVAVLPDCKMVGDVERVFCVKVVDCNILLCTGDDSDVGAFCCGVNPRI